MCRHIDHLTNSTGHLLHVAKTFLVTDLLGFCSKSNTSSIPNLSDDVLQNLLDSLSTLTLTIAALSLGLLSNVGIVANDIANQARNDLQSLLKIQDKLSESTPIQLIQEVEPRYGPTQTKLTLFVTTDGRSLIFNRPSWLKLQIPAVLHPVWSLTDSGEEVAGVEEDQKLSALETLGKWRLFWNTLSTNPFLLDVQN